MTALVVVVARRVLQDAVDHLRHVVQLPLQLLPPIAAAAASWGQPAACILVQRCHADAMCKTRQHEPVNVICWCSRYQRRRVAPRTAAVVVTECMWSAADLARRLVVRHA